MTAVAVLKLVDDNLIGTRPEHVARAKDLFHGWASALATTASVIGTTGSLFSSFSFWMSACWTKP